MHGVGVFNEDAGELVGANVVAREEAAKDFRKVLRMLREGAGEHSTHGTMVSPKRTLQILLLMSLASSSDALSLASPICAWFILWPHGSSLWMVPMLISFHDASAWWFCR